MKQEHVLSCQVARYLRMRGYVTLDCDGGVKWKI